MTFSKLTRARPQRFCALALLGVASVGCGDGGDPTGSGGEGTVSFTTWGEGYIEQEIPPDPSGQDGFVDGWTVTYEHFLVNFAEITVADASGAVAARLPGEKLFDNHAPGVKSIVDFERVPARAYTRVSYAIAPPTDAGELDPSVKPDLRQRMIEGGFSVYVEAKATRGSETHHFAWGFPISTRYVDCHSFQGGRDETGFVVTNNATLRVELTTHGDHLYYDRLQSSPDPAVPTSLRFDAIAAAAGGRAEITLEDLDAVSMATLVGTYDLSGLRARTLGEFVSRLVRTVGHFRGEGECNVEAF